MTLKVMNQGLSAEPGAPLAEPGAAHPALPAQLVDRRASPGLLEKRDDLDDRECFRPRKPNPCGHQLATALSLAVYLAAL